MITQLSPSNSEVQDNSAVRNELPPVCGSAGCHKIWASTDIYGASNILPRLMPGIVLPENSSESTQWARYKRCGWLIAVLSLLALAPGRGQTWDQHQPPAAADSTKTSVKMFPKGWSTLGLAGADTMQNSKVCPFPDRSIALRG